MQSCCLEPPEDMALRKEDQIWVADKIREDVKEHLNPHGRRKAREFIPLAGILGVFVGLMALAGSGWFYAFSRVDKEARFEQSTTDSLSRIDERLKLIPAQIAAVRYSTAPPKELKAHRDELADLKRSLANIPPDTPNFWPTSFQVITLLSKTISGIKPSSKPEVDLTDVSGVNFGKNLVFPPGTRVFLHKRIANSVFTDTVVRFDPNVILENVTFVNCILIFPELQQPSKPLQNIGNVLLMASDLSNITIPAS